MKCRFSATVLLFTCLVLAFFSVLPTRAQTSFTQGDALSNRTYNSDSGPTNSQLTLDFPITQAGTLQDILVLGESSGLNISGIGQSFRAFILRPVYTNYQVVFVTSYFTVTNVGTNTFVIPGTPFGLLPGDVLAHYGRGIPFSNNTGGPSSVYIASNLPVPTNGQIISVPGPVYPLYNDGGRNYAVQVQASEFIVTANSDHGPGSLRQAVLSAAALPGTSTITFAPNLSGQVITLTNGQIAISNNLTIDASALAGGIQINPNYNSRIFAVFNTTAVFNSLLLTNGNANDDTGATIQNNSGMVTVNSCLFTENAAYYGYGGAVANILGTMTVNNCSFLYNFADAPVPQPFIYGGGAIYNQNAHLTVNDCSFVGNSATSGTGGAIFCNGTNGVTLNNCTFAGNQANGSGGSGGGVCDQSGAAVAVNNCTFFGNSATNSSTGGGGIFTSGNLNLTNCIVCSNSAPAGAEIYCGGFLTIINPLLGVGSGAAFPSFIYYHNGFVSGNEIDTTNPLLAPLGNYGGSMLTMPPLPGSPAIDAGNDSVTGFLATDQRGLPRKAGSHVDIGAVELQPGDSNGVVTTTADAGFGSLREAVLYATYGSTNRVTFTNTLSGQAILLTSGQIVLNSNVTIDASALPNGIQINGNGQSRIFEITNNATVVLNSLTITNGSDEGEDSNIPGYGGGGIFCRGSLTVTNCIVAGNQADFSTYGGGGISSISGTLTVNNSTFTGNHASGCDQEGGGGIYAAGTLTVNNCTFIGNQADSGLTDNGGGIDSSFGPLTVNNSTFIGNRANNTFANGGGGIFTGLGMGIVNNSTFIGNQSTNNQTANGSGAGGGGIFNGNTTLIVNNSTFTGNEAYGNRSLGGGAILNVNTCILTNSIIWSNTAPSGFELANRGSMTIVNCLLGTNGVVNVSGGTTNFVSCLLNGNALLAPLGNYGGLTQTMPPEPGSPAIAAGNNAVLGSLTTDQRGLPRSSGGHVDIGSVEIQSGQSYNIVENNLDNGPGSLRQVVSNAPFGGTITFAPSLSGQTILLTSGQIVLSNSVTIDASALPNGIQINGHGSSRIFQVPSTKSAILSALTLTNGNPGSGNPGGGILNNGLLIMAACTLAGNLSAYGGAIENENTCELFECTLYGNSAATGNGGAIDNNAGPLELLQCTIAANSASGGGGGIANYLNTLAMTNCIIAGNTAGGSGADIYNFPSSTVNAGGTNIVVVYAEAVGSTNNGVSSLFGLPPMLAPLGNYGGTTPTMPPLRGSPAIDGGSAAALAAENFTVDQRGYPRVSGARVDIGAVEAQIASANFALSNVTRLGNGTLQFNLPNLVGGSYTVFATTNLLLPFNTWSNLGPVAESPVGSGNFQFTDTQAKNFTNRFYRVTSP